MTPRIVEKSDGNKRTCFRRTVREAPPRGLALEQYTQGRLFGEVWKRPGLALRDRSIVTLAALIARNQTIEMPYYVNLALDNGVTPLEMSEIIYPEQLEQMTGR
jgi:4-carboxymuconolactone decarboxylase